MELYLQITYFQFVICHLISSPFIFKKKKTKPDGVEDAGRCRRRHRIELWVGFSGITQTSGVLLECADHTAPQRRSTLTQFFPKLSFCHFMDDLDLFYHVAKDF